MSAPQPQTAARPASTDRPRVPAGLRLQWEPAQQAHVLLYPEGMVKLNASAGHILTRCDGERSVAQVVDDLKAAFTVEGVAPDLESDVLAFLSMARERGWVTW